MTSTYFAERLKSVSGEAGPPTSGTSGPKVNALQGRIASVLSASYADLEIRDALATLDERQIHNTPETRRNLRVSVQQELIECNGEVVRDFGQVADQLRRVGETIASLNKSCAAIRAHVAAANRETGPMLDESSTMHLQKRQAETKQQLLGAFTTHFMLSDTESSALTSTAEPVTDTFFDALERAKKVHHDSQVLLGTENQRLGLEILDKSSKQLNTAFQKLFRWTQRELRTLDLEDPQLSRSVRRALRVLAERPALFQGCLDFFAESREHVLSDSFYSALTGATPEKGAGPMPGKAIELNAHDPLRYVSDMLAWAHAATVGEREALQILFISDADEIAKNLRAGRASQPWLVDTPSGHDGEEAPAFDGKSSLNALVDRDLTGVVRQVRQRTEQIVRSHEDAALAYQISNLVAFYSSIFSTLLGPESGMVEALRPVTDQAFDTFRTIMRDHVANLHRDTATATADLSPPGFLDEALETLKRLMRSYDTSLAHAASAQERKEGFRLVLAEALDPYLAGCHNISKRMMSPDGQIFVSNCFTAAKMVMRGYAFTVDRIAEIAETLDEEEERMVTSVHAWFLAESGMQGLVDVLGSCAGASSANDVQELSKSKVLDPENLGETAQRLDAFLPGAMEDARAFIGRLADKMMLRRICEKAADGFVGDFENAERLLTAVDEIQDIRHDGPEMGADEEEPLLLRDVFPRTTAEIRVLLS